MNAARFTRTRSPCWISADNSCLRSVNACISHLSYDRPRRDFPEPLILYTGQISASQPRLPKNDEDFIFPTVGWGVNHSWLIFMPQAHPSTTPWLMQAFVSKLLGCRWANVKRHVIPCPRDCLKGVRLSYLVGLDFPGGGRPFLRCGREPAFSFRRIGSQNP